MASTPRSTVNGCLTQDEASDRFLKKGVDMIEPYWDQYTRILVLCRLCGHAWKATPCSFWSRPEQNIGCSRCSHRLTAERKRPRRHCLNCKRKFVLVAGSYSVYCSRKCCAEGQTKLLANEWPTRCREAGLEAVEDYVGTKAAILVRGPCGHEWRITPSRLGKVRCRYCNRRSRRSRSTSGKICGFNPGKPAILYYVKMSGAVLDAPVYKIGITNHSIEKRFRSERGIKYEVLLAEYFQCGKEARAKEQGILRKYAEYRYTAEILSRGNSEIFGIDVLGLLERRHQRTKESVEPGFQFG